MPRALGEFELLLLSAVLRLGDEAYGAQVVREIQRRTGRETSSGAVYTGLDRLEARGLLTSAVGGEPLHRDIRGDAEADDARDVLGPAAAVAFLRTADHLLDGHHVPRAKQLSNSHPLQPGGRFGDHREQTVW